MKSTWKIFMTEIREISPAGKSDKVEEIFSCLRLPGIASDFLISKEELLDATWIYRIYNFDEISWRRIEEYEFTRIKALLADAADTFNSTDMISAQSKINKLVKLWKKYWFNQTPHGINPIETKVFNV